MFTLAHLSDPHLAPLPAPSPGQLCSKRILGYLSWRTKRRNIHQSQVTDTLCRDLAAAAPDHVVVTGDICNISLPAEFEAGAAWLKSLGEPDRVTVIPGNHDAYVKLPWHETWGLWADYMTGERAGGNGAEQVPPADFGDFPFVRRLGDVALVCMSSAHPTRPFSAAGSVGPEQLERLEDWLRRLGQEGLFRTVLVHHPPLGGQVGRRKQLTDGAALAQTVARAGAELVLHGHAHRYSQSRIEHGSGFAPVFGTAAASAMPGATPHPGQYHLYGIAREQGGWRIETTVREFAGPGEVVTRRYEVLEPG